MFVNNIHVPLKPNIFGTRFPMIICVMNQKCYSQKSYNNFVISKRALMYRNENISTNAMLPNYIFNTFSLLRTFATQKLPKDKDVFGNLSHWNFNKVEMDEQEEAEEKFTENEARLPRRVRQSVGGYANMIKSHIQQFDLSAALNVLKVVKDNRDKPTVYMYNLLIRAFAVQGDMKQCFKLYNAMKKRGLKPNEATYTSLINSIANYPKTTEAMEKLKLLKETFLVKGIVLNDTHYNAMINAYGRHNKVLESFQMADEMRDRKLQITECTFNTLLCCAISDKKAGMRHTLMVWHLMKLYKIKPSTKTYNLLLRAIKETKFGDLKVNDILITGEESSKICVKEDERPNLLATPPTVSNIQLIKDKMPSINKCSKSLHKLPVLDTSLLKCDLNNAEEITTQHDLNAIHNENPLILFGGFEHILQKMKDDDAVPDVKTMTYLLQLTPNSVAIEKLIMQHAHANKIPLDTEFFNVLMKKRCFRHDYDSARHVLHDMQIYNLQPDIITWGTLALTCDFPEDAINLLDTMESIGCVPNDVILSILLVKVSRSKQKDKFETMLKLMEYMRKNNIKPTKLTIQKLNAFKKEVKDSIKIRDKSARSKTFRENFTKFCAKYEKWKKSMGMQTFVHELN